MKQAGLKTVVVLVAGRPMIIDAILPMAEAIVVTWRVADPDQPGRRKLRPLFPYAHGLTY
jgi:hypothetical protein